MTDGKKRPGALWQIGRWVGPIALVFCAVAGLAVAIGVGAGGWDKSWRWLGPAFAGPLFLACAAVLVLGAIMLVVLCTALWRIGASNRASAGRGEKGSAMVEFMLVLPLALTLVLVMVQAAVLMAGNLCVHYAAFCAARAAVVQVPTNSPAEGPNIVGPKGSSAKRQQIELAAVYAVMPISCGSADLPNQSIPLQAGLDRFFQLNNTPTPGWVTQLGRKWQYARNYTTVDLNPPANGVTYAENEDLIVNVTHTFYLAVPFARTLFALGNDGVRLDLGAPGLNAEYGTIIRATCAMTNEGAQDFVDVEQFPPN